MDAEKQLAHDIYQVDIRSQYDAACKLLLAGMILLAHIMKSCLEEYQDVPIEDIAKRYIEGTAQVGSAGVMPDDTNRPEGDKITGMANEDKLDTEGAVFYDIRFMAAVPSGDAIRIIINVEAQQRYQPGYPLVKRCIYYCARMISAQKGTEFRKSEYGKIKKVYSIWICMDAPESAVAQYPCGPVPIAAPVSLDVLLKLHAVKHAAGAVMSSQLAFTVRLITW